VKMLMMVAPRANGIARSLDAACNRHRGDVVPRPELTWAYK